MTEFYPKRGKTFGAKTQIVHFLALFFAASAAQAGAWEEFEQRCLVPMENVQAPITSGLVLSDEYPLGKDNVERRYDIGAMKKLFVALNEEKEATACTLAIEGNAGLELVEKLWNHFEPLVGSGEYEVVEKDSFVLEGVQREFGRVRSTFQREPKLEVYWTFDPNFISTASAEETDLES